MTLCMKSDIPQKVFTFLHPAKFKVRKLTEGEVKKNVRNLFFVEGEKSKKVYSTKKR